MICGSGGSKSRLAQTAGAEPCRQRRNEQNCTPLWREVHVQVKMDKTLAFWNAFGGLDVEKVSDR